VVWGVQDENLMKQWKGHDEEERAKEQIEQSLLIFPKPSKFIKHVIKVLRARLFSIPMTRFQVLRIAHISKSTITWD